MEQVRRVMDRGFALALPPSETQDVHRYSYSMVRTLPGPLVSQEPATQLTGHNSINLWESMYYSTSGIVCSCYHYITPDLFTTGSYIFIFISISISIYTK